LIEQNDEKVNQNSHWGSLVFYDLFKANVKNDVLPIKHSYPEKHKEHCKNYTNKYKHCQKHGGCDFTKEALDLICNFDTTEHMLSHILPNVKGSGVT